MSKIQRHFYTTSSCGICGKASLAAIRADNIRRIESDFKITAVVIQSLPELLRQHQNVFAKTGGLHGAGLATPQGEMIESREDIGRHNAVDKLIGSQLLGGSFPVRRPNFGAQWAGQFRVDAKSPARIDSSCGRRLCTRQVSPSSWPTNSI